MSKKPKNSRHLAKLSLIIMGVGFVATLPFEGSFLIDLLQGGFEAGLVGGLADWFAVTALFRHPLGLPIPHTALLPNNRQRMTNAVVSMLKNDWLSKESIKVKLRQIQISEKLFSILEKEIYSPAVRKGFISLATRAIRKIPIEKLTPLIEKEIKNTFSSIDMSVILQTVVNQVLKNEYDKKGFDYVLLKVNEWLKKDSTRTQLGVMASRALNNVEADGILQFALKSLQSMLNEEKLGNIIKNLLLNIIKGLQNEDDANRKALLIYINTELNRMPENEKLIMECNTWKDSLITELNLQEKITASLQNLQQKAIEFLEDTVTYDTKILPFMNHLLNELKDNPKAAEIENWLQNQIGNLVEHNHEKIGKLVEENLDKIDNDTLVSMMENNVGKDLQWIRVNGAVCGFIIGIFLTIIKTFI